MRTRTHLAGVVAVLTLLASCRTQSSTFTDQDLAAISAMFAATVGYVEEGDWEAWAAQYTEDAVLYPPNAPAVTGRAAILAWGGAFPQVLDFGFWNVEVMGHGDLAYGTSAYAMTLEGFPADTGVQLVVIRRTADGWKAVAAIFNSDLPIPAP